MQYVHPIVAPFVPEVRLALRDLVRVVGESVVDAAAVDVETLSEVLHSDAGTFDVPAGVSRAPRAVPFELLGVELRFRKPKREVGAISLVRIFFDAVAHADGKILFLKIVKSVVIVELRRIEINVSARFVGISLFDKRRYNAYKIVDARGCGLYDVGDADVQFFTVGEKSVGVEFRDLHNGLVLAARAFQHFVVARVAVAREVTDVRYVHNAGNVVPRVTQISVEYVLHNIRAQIADVGIVIYRRTAGIHLDLAGLAGDEFFSFVGEGVI